MSASTRWRSLTFESTPFANLSSSLDMHGDGSAVLVPLPGHTPGSIGLYLRDAGRVSIVRSIGPLESLTTWPSTLGNSHAQPRTPGLPNGFSF